METVARAARSAQARRVPAWHGMRNHFSYERDHLRSLSESAEGTIERSPGWQPGDQESLIGMSPKGTAECMHEPRVIEDLSVMPSLRDSAFCAGADPGLPAGVLYGVPAALSRTDKTCPISEDWRAGLCTLHCRLVCWRTAGAHGEAMRRANASRDGASAFTGDYPAIPGYVSF